VITAAQYADEPYGVVTLDVERTNRTIILAPPVRMDFRGLTAEMLKPGATVIVEGLASKRSPDELRAELITVGGRTFDLR